VGGICRNPSSHPYLNAADKFLALSKRRRRHSWQRPVETIVNHTLIFAPCRKGVIMTITYAGIIDRPGFSSAIQGFVNRLRLPRQRRNNGNALVAVDLSERPTVTAHLPDEQSVVATLTARIETLESEFAKVEAAAAIHRADFERERERCERLMAEVLKATAEMMVAREAAARLAGELAAIQARPWWRRLIG
jgi:hypothetical protein